MIQQNMKFEFKYILMLLLIVMVALLWFFFLRYYISYDFLVKNHNILSSWRDDNYNFTVITFIIIYVTTVALSLPGATMMSLTGGFLFSTFPGVFFNLLSAVIGATLIFIAAKTFLGNILLDKIKRKQARDNFFIKMQNEIQENEFSYLIILRLMPIVPFFIANLAPAFFGVKLRIFIVTTLIGISPGTVVYTSIGAGLSNIFKNDNAPSLDFFSNPFILISSVGLFALAIFPIIIKKLKKAN